jgi:hypothetical protein
MKAGTIPFPREFTVGDVGIDCRAVKRALANWFGNPDGLDLKSNAFGPRAGMVLKAFQNGHGLTPDGVYGPATHEKMRSYFDEYGASLMAKKAYSLSAQKQRDDYVAAWVWAIAHHVQNDYREIRPIPLWLQPFETSTRIETDCSGESVLLADWEKLPDPGGMAFNGQGNTGTILHHCTKVTIAQALPADLIVYRAGSWDTYGHHVVAILERVSATDFKIGSNGHQTDPGEYLHSAMAASQARSGYPDVVFCRWLPAA